MAILENGTFVPTKAWRRLMLATLTSEHFMDPDTRETFYRYPSSIKARNNQGTYNQSTSSSCTVGPMFGSMGDYTSYSYIALCPCDISTFEDDVRGATSYVSKIPASGRIVNVSYINGTLYFTTTFIIGAESFKTQYIGLFLIGKGSVPNSPVPFYKSEVKEDYMGTLGYFKLDNETLFEAGGTYSFSMNIAL